MKLNKSSELEFEEVIKIILLVLTLLVLIYIVGIIINGNLTEQVDKLKNVFSNLF